MPSTLPTFLPLVDAARKYNLPEKVLTQLIQAGKIEAARLPSGEILVSDYDLGQGKTKEEMVEERHGKLQGRPITVTQAAEKYDLNRRTIIEWTKNGYITILKPGYRMELNEAEVAYCADIYHQRKADGIRSGVPLLDDDGLPYQLKHPSLSEYRRRKKRRMTRR